MKFVTFLIFEASYPKKLENVKNVWDIVLLAFNVVVLVCEYRYFLNFIRNVILQFYKTLQYMVSKINVL